MPHATVAAAVVVVAYLIQHRCGQQILIDFWLEIVLGTMAPLVAIAEHRQLPVGACVQADLGYGAAGAKPVDAAAAAADADAAAAAA